MMTGRYQAYPEYKDSDVEWLGKIPSHWLIAPFKWQIERNDGGVWGNDPDGIDDTIVLRSTEQTVNGNWILDDPAPRKISAAEKSFALLKTGDLLVTKSSGSSLHIGKTTLVSSEIEAMGCCYSNFMQRVRTKSSLMPKLAWYVMNNELARKQFDFLSNSTTGLANLNGTMIGQILFALPKMEEQKTIVEFLDYETAKIDTLIEKQQQLIQLLKEKRQAVISHAVTKGLNPDAPMRDSGVEWLGEVPKHWDVAKLSFRYEVQLGKMLDDKKITGNYLGTYLRNTDVQWDSINDENLPVMDFRPDERERYSVKKGDLIVCEGGEIGRCAIWTKEESCFYQKALHRLRPLNQSKDYNRFLFYTLFDAVHRERFISGAGKATIAHLPAEIFRQYRFSFPPYGEQVEISMFLDRQKEKYDILESKAEQQIILLQERRTALISAAVTGKIDVRNWQPAKGVTT